MTFNYLGGRMVPYPQEKHPEVSGKLETIAKHFDESWLEAVGKHPLQELWQRRDVLATNELAWLGDSIQHMQKIDTKWVAREVEKVKSGAENDRAGSIFEIMAIAAFVVEGQSVIPMGKDNPGFDATLKRENVPDLHISLKTHRTSKHEQYVRDEATKIEDHFKKLMQLRGVNGVGVRIVCPKYPDTASLWKSLSDNLEFACRRSLDAGKMVAVDAFWGVFAHPLPAEYEPWSKTNVSYQVVLMAPHHRNEFDNMRDNLSKACNNIRKHAKPSDFVDRFILLRVPPTTSVALCAEWARQYFDEGDEIVTGLMLYQPAVVRSQQATGLGHFNEIVINQKLFNTRSQPFRAVKERYYVGSILSEPGELQLQSEGRTLSVRDSYIYQSGEFYTAYDIKMDLNIYMSLDSLAPGVRRHAVLRDGDREAVLQGNFAARDDLVLLP